MNLKEIINFSNMVSIVFNRLTIMQLKNLDTLFKLFNKPIHQYKSSTSIDRYPKTFRFVKSLMKGEKLQILSFGCSTGEECFTLSDYFTGSSITGADINIGNIKIAKKNNFNNSIRFILSPDDLLRENLKYDIVFCMSVFCRWPILKGVKNSEVIYPFKIFEKGLEFIDKFLKKNGYLVLHNNSYLFQDSSIFYRYSEVISSDMLDIEIVDKFSRNGYPINQLRPCNVFQKLYD